MALVLDAAYYDDVRRAVDPTVDPDAFPDEDIASEPYAGRAARFIVRMVPDYASKDENLVQIALMYVTASYLAEALPVIKQSKLPDQEMIFDTYDRVGNSKRLMAMAMDVIEDLNAAKRTLTLPTFFTIATGTYRR